MAVIVSWLAAFALTCTVELAVVRALVPGARPAVVLAAQAATHPAVWIGMAVLPLPQAVALALVETMAAAAESAIYQRRLGLSWRRAVEVSALANAASLGVAMVLGDLWA
jgi:hypothetical protein